MSDLAKEVAAELKGSGLNWWQRSALIVASNVIGLVLGAIIISAGGIVYTKAMSTDDIKEDLEEQAEALREEQATAREAAAAERATILETLATISAEQDRLRQLFQANQGASGDAPAGVANVDEPVPGVPFLQPEPAPEPPQQQVAAEPTASDVRAKRDEIQQRIDEEVYRAKHLRAQ